MSGIGVGLAGRLVQAENAGKTCVCLAPAPPLCLPWGGPASSPAGPQCGVPAPPLASGWSPVGWFSGGLAADAESPVTLGPPHPLPPP